MRTGLSHPPAGPLSPVLYPHQQKSSKDDLKLLYTMLRIHVLIFHKKVTIHSQKAAAVFRCG
jgi:hypothetical protein